MANFMDYLQWRGDLSFEQSPFCEVDNIIFSYLAYVKLEGVAPAPGEAAITIQEAVQRFFEKNTEEMLAADHSFVHLAPYMMRDMANTNRFGGLRFQRYLNLIDPEQELQFSAVEILLEDGTSYIAFRGTDDTIVGWKEDFAISAGVVPSETAAAAYLNEAGKHAQGAIRVGGHSKGGNLAVYAAACCEPEIQERLLAVYSNDGPGFTEEFLQSEGLKRIHPKLHRYIPESSMIGMLMEHAVEPVIVTSTQKGMLQHDAFSWNVLGNHFETAQELSKSAQTFHNAIQSWLSKIPLEERKSFVQDFFSVLEVTGAVTIPEVQAGGLKNAALMMKKMETLEPNTKHVIESLLKEVLTHWTGLVSGENDQKEQNDQTDQKEVKSKNKVVEILSEAAMKVMPDGKNAEK